MVLCETTMKSAEVVKWMESILATWLIRQLLGVFLIERIYFLVTCFNGYIGEHFKCCLNELPLSINIGNVLLLIFIVCSMLEDGLLYVRRKKYSSDDDESA